MTLHDYKSCTDIAASATSSLDNHGQYHCCYAFFQSQTFVPYCNIELMPLSLTVHPSQAGPRVTRRITQNLYFNSGAPTRNKAGRLPGTECIKATRSQSFAGSSLAPTAIFVLKARRWQSCTTIRPSSLTNWHGSRIPTIWNSRMIVRMHNQTHRVRSHACLVS